jgi:hypothetical protein
MTGGIETLSASSNVFALCVCLHLYCCYCCSLLGSIWTAAGTTAGTSAAGSTSTLTSNTSPPPPPVTAVGGPLHSVPLHSGQQLQGGASQQLSSSHSSADAAASATTLDELNLPPPLRSSSATAAATAGAHRSSTSSPLAGIGAAVSGAGVKQAKSHSIDSGACSPLPAAVAGHRSRRNSRSPLSPKVHVYICTVAVHILYFTISRTLLGYAIICIRCWHSAVW